MVLDDAGLTRFALGVATAAAAFLAVSVAVLTFLFDRRKQEEVEAFSQVRRNADQFYSFLVQNVGSNGNYIVDLDSYLDFALLISQLSIVFSSDYVPGYISWRQQTSRVTLRSVQVGQEVQIWNEQALKGEFPDNFDQDKFQFHRDFGNNMQKVDEAIQELDWAAGTRRAGVRTATVLVASTGILLLAGLLVALLAAVNNGGGLSDKINFYVGLVLLALALWAFATLMQFFRIIAVPRNEWIDRKVKQLRKTTPVNS